MLAMMLACTVEHRRVQYFLQDSTACASLRPLVAYSNLFAYHYNGAAYYTAAGHADNLFFTDAALPAEQVRLLAAAAPPMGSSY